MMAGKRTPRAHFPYNIKENSPTSFARNSVFVGPNDSKFGTEIRFTVYQNLGQINHNFHNHVFDDVKVYDQNL